MDQRCLSLVNTGLAVVAGEITTTAEQVIRPVVPERFGTDHRVVVNPTGIFVRGGPHAGGLLLAPLGGTQLLRLGSTVLWISCLGLAAKVAVNVVARSVVPGVPG